MIHHFVSMGILNNKTHISYNVSSASSTSLSFFVTEPAVAADKIEKPSSESLTSNAYSIPLELFLDNYQKLAHGGAEGYNPNKSHKAQPNPNDAIGERGAACRKLSNGYSPRNPKSTSEPRVEERPP